MKTRYSYYLAFLLFWYVGTGFAQRFSVERTPAGKPGSPLVTSEFRLTSGQTSRINPYGSRWQTRNGIRNELWTMSELKPLPYT